MTNPYVSKLCGFVGLSDKEIGALERVTAHPRIERKGKDLIREGDQPGPVIVMLEGWAFRYKVLPNGSRQITAFLMPGDACDLHIGLLREMDHSIQTVGVAKVVTISRSAMDTMMAEYPQIARAMYIAQLVDEGTLRAWIVSLGRRSSIEGLAHLLLELFLRASRANIAQNGALELPLTQQVLADAVGMTPVHVNRMLQELRRSGAVELSRGILRIQDPIALTQLAGFDDNYLHKRLP